VLAHSLQRNRRDVQANLGRLISNESHSVQNRSAQLRRRVIVPVAGILVSLTAVGGLLLVRSSDTDAAGEDVPAYDSGSTSTARPRPGVDVPVELGDAVVADRSGIVRTR